MDPAEMLGRRPRSAPLGTPGEALDGRVQRYLGTTYGQWRASLSLPQAGFWWKSSPVLLLFRVYIIVKSDGGMIGRLFDTPESRMITSNSMWLR